MMGSHSIKGRPWLAALVGLALAGPHAVSSAQAGLLDKAQDPSHVCGNAVQAAEARYPLPPGLLFAISEVESGRPADGGTALRPWPWTVQAENESHFFATKAAAISWVQAAQAQGIASIDVGCMQVNLMYHPTAFKTLDEAFDPERNADYAARFLISLHAATGDWQEAAGQYHSQTLALAIPYRQRVEAMLSGGVAALSPQETRLQKLQSAWNATMDGSTTVPPEPDLSGNWTGLLHALRAKKTPHRVRHEPIMLSDAH
jgi:hypothetical protein